MNQDVTHSDSHHFPSSRRLGQRMALGFMVALAVAALLGARTLGELRTERQKSAALDRVETQTPEKPGE